RNPRSGPTPPRVRRRPRRKSADGAHRAGATRARDPSRRGGKGGRRVPGHLGGGSDSGGPAVRRERRRGDRGQRRNGDLALARTRPAPRCRRRRAADHQRRARFCAELSRRAGRSQLMLLPEGAEVEMGLTAYREVLSKGKISGDSTLNAQVTRVGRRIAEATGKNYQWEFRVLEDKQVNAFCLPGGKVAVYTGLLPLAQDDAGLAAVLGHEVSHAIARHGGERVSQGLLVQTGLAAT